MWCNFYPQLMQWNQTFDRFNFHVHVRRTMNDMLEGFMAYLEMNRLVEFDTKNEDEYDFRSANRLQWYVLLAKRFGLDMDYEYDMYFDGPQSRALMSDYTKYMESHVGRLDGKMVTAQVVIRLSKSFQSEEFLDFVKDRDDDWLEIATTLIKRSKPIPKRDDLIQNIEWTTNGFSIEYITNVLDDLQTACVIDLEQ